jgi:cytochrome-b5 reductase
MSKAQYAPPSLTGKPTKALIPPGKCQISDEFLSVPLLERVPVSPTSSLFRFGLPNPSAPLNLSTCACLLAKANIIIQNDDNDNQEVDNNAEDVVIRPYTPISTNELKGCFDLLVKNYGPGAKMSRHLHEIKVGDTIDFKHIPANVKIQAPFRQTKIAMLVGGTGITPMIQALHAILGDDAESDKQYEVVMLYGSKASNDILGKTMVDAWAKEYMDRFQVVHVLSEEREDSEWKGLRGHIDKNIMETYLPDPSVGDDLIILVCGPPPMYQALCGPREEEELTGLLAEMGYAKEQVYKF